MASMEVSVSPYIAEFLQCANAPLLALVGPTSSGKTALSLKIATALSAQGSSVEVINADSRQLYRFLNIGTGKIIPDEMLGVPHHLLDVLDPREEVTAAWYKREAERVIADIHARGHIPFLVGGSMLYVSAIIDNLEFVGRSAPTLRQRLQDDLMRDGSDALYQRLQELDPEGALRIDPRNTVYLLRALEVCESSGTTLQEAKKKNPSPYDLLILGKNLAREEIHRRIEERINRMFAQGWPEEVMRLLARGYSVNDPGMQSVGYREIASQLTKGISVDSVKSDQALKDSISAKTRQYARRQLTWWRNDERIHWAT